MNNSDDARRQVRALRELPQAVAPARDLWPDIARQLPPRRRAWIVPASLAAGVLLAALGIGLGFYGRSVAPPAGAQPGADTLIRTAFTADPAYLRQRDQLLRDLPGKLEHLSPESQQRVRDSLQSIQAATQDLETELGHDAGNALLQELLISTYREQMRVLIAVNEIDGPNEEL
jgi:hypothetical protein